MNCSICGMPISSYGNNPFPLCSVDDYDSRCCDDCNNMVINARIAMTKKDDDINIGDTIVIFYAKGSDSPTKMIGEQMKFLAGIVESVVKKNDSKETIYEGSWGSFVVNSKTDQFVKV